MNGAASGVIAVETILGDGPTLKGNLADLVARLAVLLDADGHLKQTGFTGLTTDYGLLASSASAVAVMNHTPIGSMTAYGGAAAPTNWLLCDGSAVSRATYVKLFTALSTAYGVGDGATTFNLPDMRGRIPMGVDGAANRITAASTNGGNADTLGGVGGAETHTLVTAEMPAHTHVERHDNNNGGSLGAGNGIAGANADGADTVVNTSTSSTGGGGAHSNTQPWQTVNWIIFAGV